MHSFPLHPQPQRPAGRHSGFTLTELMVVITIIVLLIAVAIPAFNIITGNRSIDSAQNQLQAILGRARQEAMALQDYRGVILFTDPNTGRIAAAQVSYPTSGSNVLGLAPNHDETLLPKGISFRTIEDGGGYGTMNVIMFDGQGQFTTKPWVIVNGTDTTVSMASPPQDPASRLSWRIQPVPNYPPGMPAVSNNGSSAFGLVLFTDEAAYQTAFNANQNTNYLNDNGISFMINRYGGTLLRTE